MKNVELSAEKKRAKYLARRKKYYKKNKDKWRKYQLDNRGRLNKYWREWNAKNPDKKKEIVDRYIKNNEARRRKSSSKYQKSNSGYYAAKCAERRARKFMATPDWVDTKKLEAIYVEASEKGLTVDHIVPLKHPLVCGLHVPWNLQLLDNSQNASKNNKFEVL